MPQTIPISLQWIPLGNGFLAVTPNELGVAIASHLSATIEQDVAFLITGAAPPSTDTGGLFFNTATQSLMYWDATLGAFYPINQNIAIGQARFQYTDGDDISLGWVKADGRVIDDITALTANQNSNLHDRFGAGAAITIPTVTAPASAGGTGSGTTLYSQIFCGYPVSS